MVAEAKNLFQAESQSLHQILSEPGVGYYIPPYQRPYRWSKDKVEKLLEDILLGIDKLQTQDDSFCFLGTVITFNDTENVTVQPQVQGDLPAKVLNLIDGQQRLTTLIILCVALHDHVRRALQKLDTKIKKTNENHYEEYEWLKTISTDVLASLHDTFIFNKGRGDKPLYPRMIRAFDDQWCVNATGAKRAIYESPVARLIDLYINHDFNSNKEEFSPGINILSPREGEEDLFNRYKEISSFLGNIYKLKNNLDLGSMPSLKELVYNKKFQQAIIGYPFPEKAIEAIQVDKYEKHVGLLNLIIFSNYVLKRVAITVVQGKNEEYAFNVFESLNTTGEPLTAFETFRPKVVSIEKLENYETSKAREYLDQVSEYLKKFEAGIALQDGTRDLLINFALLETGEKLPKRLSDQRKYLQDEYAKYSNNQLEREKFLKNLRDLAIFSQYSWVPPNSQPTLHELPADACTNTIKLCLAFLQKLNHTITVPLLTRFYSAVLNAEEQNKETQKSAISDLEGAIKAITAFSVLWRASRRGTDSIDSVYRELMSGSVREIPNEKVIVKIGGFARMHSAKQLRDKDNGNTLLPRSLSLDLLKTELKNRLMHDEYGGIKNKEDFVVKATAIPAYRNNQTVTRFLLLAAHHDAVEDSKKNGLIEKGRSGVSQCLTYESWINENTLSLEHIAPETKTDDWNQELYSDDVLKHTIGNLVLVQSAANSSLSNRPWKQKAFLYKALGANTQEDSKKILEAANSENIIFANSTEQLIQMSSYMPQLISLGLYGIDNKGEWTKAKVDERSRRLLELSWDVLYSWLT